MANVVKLPGAADKPVRQPRKSKGYWGERERAHPPNTMPDDRKRVRIKNPDNPDGPLLNFTGKTLTEARAKRDAFLKNRADRLNLVAKPNPKRLNEWADTWYTIYGGDDIEGKTKSLVKVIKNSELGEKYLEEITHADIQTFANGFVQSKSYVHKISSTLRSLFVTAIENGLMEKSPVEKIKWTHTGETSHRALEKWERDMIGEHWHKYPAGIGAMLMLFTGERPGEARAQSKKLITDSEILIRDSSRFGRDGHLILQPGRVKTEAGFRDIPIWPQLRDVICFAARHEHDLVWLSATGNELSSTAQRRNWESFMHALRCIKLGLSPNVKGDYSSLRIDKLSEADKTTYDALFDFSPYSLRHTFCTMLYEANVDLKTAQYLMGHNDPTTTLKIYTHLSSTKKQDGIAKAMDYFRTLKD